jgi:DNA mismatch repair ATPase MutS
VKAYLMHRDADLDLEQELPRNTEILEEDLEIGTLLNVMAAGDEFLWEIAQRGLLLPLTDPEAIMYRQQVLGDCIQQPDLVRQLYGLAVEGVESPKRANVFWFRDSPDQLLSKSLRILETLIGVVERLRKLTDENAAAVRSDGFTRLFSTLHEELNDEYLQELRDHLHRLDLSGGTLISAELGRSNRGTNYVLRKPFARSFFERIDPRRRGSYSFSIPPRDEAGMESLGMLRNRGVRLVANALAQSTDHMLDFFRMLRAELGFYVGCINLHEQLSEKETALCFPDPAQPEKRSFTARAISDASLPFHLPRRVVGNDIDGDGRQLFVITGANQGGKSTFLRSVGLAQLMMQAGMFVAAESLSASVRTGVFTHFKREEDASMTSGKLDEELARMSDIADLVEPNALLLCNESFAATNEREGSEIARQVIRAMVEADVTVFFVTHLFDLANGFYQQNEERNLFLRAERQVDGERPFRVSPGKPLATSFGEDSYNRIFKPPAEPALAEGAVP